MYLPTFSSSIVPTSKMYFSHLDIHKFVNSTILVWLLCQFLFRRDDG